MYLFIFLNGVASILDQDSWLKWILNYVFSFQIFADESAFELINFQRARTITGWVVGGIDKTVRHDLLTQRDR